MFDVANWVSCLNVENGPGGTPLHEALSVSSRGDILSRWTASFPGQKQFLHTRLVAEPHKCDDRRLPSSQRPQHSTLYRRSNEVWDAH